MLLIDLLDVKPHHEHRTLLINMRNRFTQHDSDDVISPNLNIIVRSSVKSSKL